MIADKTGNLYGTASEGGSCQWTDFNGCGTVFKLSPRGSLKVLHTFSGYPDGAVPVAGLTFDKEGNLYGTTVYGGHSSCWDVGCGTVFKIKPNGSYTVFHSFCEQGVTICAFQPRGEIIFDARGNIYGTTYIGGNDDCDQKQGCGLAFKISPESAEHVLHIFQEGFYPLGSLIKDSNGNLYGTTQYGGGANGGIIFTVRR